MAPETRYQLGGSDTLERTRLVEHRPELKDDLIRSIRRAVGPGAMRWQAGDDPILTASNVEEGAAAMLERAVDAIETMRIRTVPDPDSGQPSVHLWVLVGDPQNISGVIPDDAREKNGPAIDLMLEFHEEVSFVFPDYKTLGGYVPRPIKDQILRAGKPATRGPCSKGGRRSPPSMRGATQTIPRGRTVMVGSTRVRHSGRSSAGSPSTRWRIETGSSSFITSSTATNSVRATTSRRPCTRDLTPTTPTPTRRSASTTATSRPGCPEPSRPVDPPR